MMGSMYFPFSIAPFLGIIKVILTEFLLKVNQFAILYFLYIGIVPIQTKSASDPFGCGSFSTNGYQMALALQV